MESQDDQGNSGGSPQQERSGEKAPVRFERGSRKI
jgi:hypothetical protein